MHIEALLDLRQGFAYGCLLAQSIAPTTYHFPNMSLPMQLKRSRYCFRLSAFKVLTPLPFLIKLIFVVFLVRFDLIMLKMPQVTTLFGALKWFEQLQPSQLYPFQSLLKITRL